MTTIVDGTTGITFPSTISGVSATQQYSGRVLQVLQVVDSTATSFTSTTFATMGGMSATITPTSTSSKILIILNLQGQNRTAGLGEDLGILRNGSNCYTQNHYSLIAAAVANNPDNNGQGGMAPVIYLDSPASSSAVTYTFQMRHRTGNSGTFSVNYALGATGAVYSTITLMEIAA